MNSAARTMPRHVRTSPGPYGSRRDALRTLIALGSTVATAVVPVPAPRAESAGSPPAFAEHEIKAGFLFNFAGFTEWPAEKLSSPEQAIVLGILGSASLAESLGRIGQRKSSLAPRRQIRVLETVAEAKECHLVFLGSVRVSGTMLVELRQARVLTVGDAQDFLDHGGMIQFLTVGENVRFDVNLPAVEHAGIRISSRVLRLAHEVRSEERSR